MNRYYIEAQAPDTPNQRAIIGGIAPDWRKFRGRRYTKFERAMQAAGVMAKGSRTRFRVVDAFTGASQPFIKGQKAYGPPRQPALEEI